MVKRNPTKSLVKGAKKPVKVKARRQPNKGQLDAAASAYAKLLADPISAPLVHPVYTGTEGGYLIRSESVFTLAPSGDKTSCVMHYTPGLINATGDELLVIDSTSSSTQWAAASYSTYTPGRSFLVSNASAVRCVATCVTVSYPGSELNRSGRIYLDQTTGGYIVRGTQYSADQVAAGLSNSYRTPDGDLQIMWKPNAADQLMAKPGDTNPGKLNDCAAITVAAIGLPPNVGLTFRITTVWEWQPAIGTGMANVSTSKAFSHNSIDDVVDSLIRGGFRFVRTAAAMYTAYQQYQRVRPALGYQ